MNSLHDWARKWGISAEAIDDLAGSFTATSQHASPSQASRGEGEVLDRVRLEASQAGWRVFRNNVGATYTQDGRFLRYGLANDSKALNDSLKSSDLIGIRPVAINPTHLGRTIGQFVALECKSSTWAFRGTKREVAQQRFLALIESFGGHGRFTTEGLI